MKRILLAVLTAAWLLCGCGTGVPRAEQPAQLLAPPFLLTGDFVLGETEGTLVLSRPEAGRFSVTFHMPDSAAGLCLSLVGDEATVALGEAHCTVPLDTLPEKHPLRLLQGLFDALAVDAPHIETGREGETVYRFAQGDSVTVCGGSVRTVRLADGCFFLHVTGLDREAS